MAERATLPRPPYVSSPLVSTINRVTCQWRENATHAFLGLAEIGGDYTAWGINVEGDYYAAVHLFLYDVPWGDDPYDTEEVSTTNPWVLMFLGSGDRSFYRRYETEEEAIARFEELDGIRFDDPGTYRYAS
ncbi:hypothetical protein [Sphingomonas sp. 3-13AW]|uniref:hypothetical protein n=1 Tax=Sphingomonas sp. 3-13AW TaxID=3050450 RepID=UPI003BB7FD26